MPRSLGFLGSEGLLLPATLPPTVTPDRFDVIAGDQIITTVEGAPPHDPGVWLALAWQYLNGTQTLPSISETLTGAELIFSAPMFPGSYQFRLMSSAGRTLTYSEPIEVGEFKLRARDDIIGRVDPDSGDIDVPILANDTWPAGRYPIVRIVAQNEIGYPATVIYIDGVPWIRIATTAVTPGAPSITITVADALPLTVVEVEVANGPGNTTDWVGLYVVGETDFNAVWDWLYLSGVHNPPALALNNAILTFTLPDVDGAYEFIFFESDSFDILATSTVVTVTTPVPVVPMPVAVNDVRHIFSYETTVIVYVLDNDLYAAGGTVTVPGGLDGNATFTIEPDRSIHVTRSGTSSGDYALTYIVTTPGGVGQATLIGTIEAFVAATQPVANDDVQDISKTQKIVFADVLANDVNTFEAVVTIDYDTLTGANAEITGSNNIEVTRIGTDAGLYSLTYILTTAGGVATATLSGNIEAFSGGASPIARDDVRNLTPIELSGKYNVLDNDSQDTGGIVTIEGEVTGANAVVIPEVVEVSGQEPIIVMRTIEVTRIGTAAGSYSLTYRVTTEFGFAEAILSGEIAEYVPLLIASYDRRNMTTTETTFLYDVLVNAVNAEGGIISAYGSTIGALSVIENNKVRVTRIGTAEGMYFVNYKLTKGNKFTTGTLEGIIDAFGSTQPPIANNDNKAVTPQNLSHLVDVLDNDRYVGSGVVTVVSHTNIDAVPEGNKVRITRIGTQVGPYSVTYRVTTPNGSATATITGTIDPYSPRIEPTAVNDIRDIAANETTVLADVLANDLNAVGALLRIVGSVTGATASVEDGYIRVTRSGTASVAYTMLYEASNAAGGTEAVLAGAIAPLGTPAPLPVANPDVRHLSATETTVLVSVIDNDDTKGFPGLITILAPATGATVARVGNQLRVTRIGTSAGSYSVLYRLSTSGGYRDATLSGTIAALVLTPAPIAHDDTRNIGAGESTNILVPVLDNDENVVGGIVTVPGPTTGITATVAGNQVRLDRIGTAAGIYSVGYQVATNSGSDIGVLSGTIAEFTTAISLSASPLSVATGGSVVVTFANGPGHSENWIGLYTLAETNMNNIYLDTYWKFLNGTQFSPPVPGLVNGSVTFNMTGVVAGSYVFRLFPHHTMVPLAVSQTVVVT